MKTLTIALVSSAVFAIVSPARADIIQIAANSFTLHAPDLTANKLGEDDNLGILQDALGSYYAAVPFPTNGNKVCRFTLVYRDNDTEIQITASLKKKVINIGGPFFTPPIVMARVRTGKATAVDTVVSKDTTNIKQPKLELGNAFYYVQIDFPGTTAEALGVLIEHKPSC